MWPWLVLAAAFGLVLWLLVTVLPHRDVDAFDVVDAFRLIVILGILAAGPGGHFFLNGRVNGVPVTFLLDTGATDIVLSPADARRAGIDPATLAFTRTYQTANGIGRGAPVTLAEISLGPISQRNVRASVNEAEMRDSILGVTFFRTLAAVEIRGDTLTIRWR